MSSIQLLGLLIAVGLFWGLRHYVVSRRVPQNLKELPGPKGYPFIGSLLDFPKEFSYHKFREWSDQYGKIYKVNILGATHIVLSDTDIANELLALRGARYSDRPRIVMLHELVSQNGNLGSSPQNEYWRNGRKLAGATITAANLKAYDSFQVDEAARLVRDLIANPKSYAYLFERYSSVVTIRILYDKNISGTPHEAEHIKTITTVVRTLEKTGAPGAYIVDFLPILKNLPNFMAPFKREAKELHNFEYSYFRALTDEAMKQYDPTTHQGPRALIQTYLDKKDGYGLSEFEIAYCLGTLFEGGSGTTSAAMQSYCLAMWHYPEWQTKVQKEIDEVVGSERLPSFDDWPSLPVVRAAMKETLRWRPVVPGGIPHLTNHDDEYNGFFIPKGAIVHANQYAMYADESLYPDAETFNPDRWINPKFPTFQAPLTEYPNLKRFSSFGFGRRICPGLVLAERSLFIEISMLMWACSVVKKLGANGRVIPVPWYDFRPGNNTGPKPFDFNLEVRDQKKVQILRDSAH